MDSVGRLLFLHGVSVVAANINEDLTESVSFKIWCWTYKCLRGVTKGKHFPKKLGRKLRVVFLVGSHTTPTFVGTKTENSAHVFNPNS